jgi:hypothetical protein
VRFFRGSVSAVPRRNRTLEKLAAGRSSPFWPRHVRDHAAMLGGKTDPYQVRHQNTSPQLPDRLCKQLDLFVLQRLNTISQLYLIFCFAPRAF